MLSQEEANRCIEQAGDEFKSMTYDELKALTKLQDPSGKPFYRALRVSGETAYVNTTITKVGRIRKRIGVEMILSAEGGTLWPHTPCVYFERYESGQLYVARPPGKLVYALFHALPYAFLGSLLIALLALVWHLFLRGG